MAEEVIESREVEETSSVVTLNDTVWIEQQRLGGNSSVRFRDVETVKKLINELEQWVDDNTEDADVVPLSSLGLGDEVELVYEGNHYHSGDAVAGTIVNGERNEFCNNGNDFEELVMVVKVYGRTDDLELVERTDDDSPKVRSTYSKTMYGDVVELSVVG